MPYAGLQYAHGFGELRPWVEGEGGSSAGGSRPATPGTLPPSVPATPEAAWMQDDELADKKKVFVGGLPAFVEKGEVRPGQGGNTGPAAASSWWDSAARRGACRRSPHVYLETCKLGLVLGTAMHHVEDGVISFCHYRAVAHGFCQSWV